MDACKKHTSAGVFSGWSRLPSTMNRTVFSSTPCGSREGQAEERQCGERCRTK